MKWLLILKIATISEVLSIPGFVYIQGDLGLIAQTDADTAQQFQLDLAASHFGLPKFVATHKDYNCFDEVINKYREFIRKEDQITHLTLFFFMHTTKDGANFQMKNDVNAVQMEELMNYASHIHNVVVLSAQCHAKTFWDQVARKFYHVWSSSTLNEAIFDGSSTQNLFLNRINVAPQNGIVTLPSISMTFQHYEAITFRDSRGNKFYNLHQGKGSNFLADYDLLPQYGYVRIGLSKSGTAFFKSVSTEKDMTMVQLLATQYEKIESARCFFLNKDDNGIGFRSYVTYVEQITLPKSEYLDTYVHCIFPLIEEIKKDRLF